MRPGLRSDKGCITNEKIVGEREGVQRKRQRVGCRWDERWVKLRRDDGDGKKMASQREQHRRRERGHLSHERIEDETDLLAVRRAKQVIELSPELTGARRGVGR